MTLSVASRRINRAAGISEHGRLVLRLIDGGLPWLEWAMHDPHARYHFENENALVAGVQIGLHAVPLVVLRKKPGLIVGPIKLMTLGLPDLRFLAHSNDDDGRGGMAVRVQNICQRNGLVTEADFARAMSWLEGLGVAPDEPLFRAMALQDRLAIHHLYCRRSELPGPASPEEAAAFALERARTPLEFVDYYKAYLQYVAAARRVPTDRERRMARVKAAIDRLQPLLYPALDCPRVDGLVASWEVAAAVEEWLMMSRRLGFSRLSRGAQQVIAHTRYPRRDGEGDSDEDEARRIVAGYLAGAQALLGSAQLGDGQIGQDGVSRTFHVRSDLEAAVIALGPDGMITLNGFRASPRETAIPPTTKRRK